MELGTEPLERLLVHLEEAIRLSKIDGEPHQRLSLILFDSACELILHRTIEPWLDLGRNLYDAYEGADRLSEAPPEALSKSRRRDVERDFNSKVDYLVTRDELPKTMGAVMKRLHEYRNETYHRDLVRPMTMHLAVQVYGSLTSQLFMDYQPLIWQMMRPDDHLPDVIAKYAPGGADRLSDGAPYAVIGRQLVDYVGPVDPRLPSLLAENILARVVEFKRRLSLLAGYLNQGDTSRKNQQKLLWMMQTEVVRQRQMAIDTIRGKRIDRIGRVTLRILDAWEATARSIAELEDPLDAFLSFINLEESLEPFEEDLEHGFEFWDRFTDPEYGPNMDRKIAEGMIEIVREAEHGRRAPRPRTARGRPAASSSPD